MRRLAVLLVGLLAACGKSEQPADAPKNATSAVAEMPPEPKGFPTPDACALLSVESVAAITGWKAPKVEPVDTHVSYLSACTFVDGAQKARFVKIAVALGSAAPKDSAEYAKTVGDRSGTLRKPATPITTLAVPVIEMDAGPDAQMMQARLPQNVELTITTQSMDLTRSLFPPALVKLRSKLPGS
jgi:hypothetical protein